MTCQQLVERLLEFVSGELDPQCQEEIQQHLHDCSACVVYVQTYQIVIALTLRLPPVPIPTHLVQRLEQLILETDKLHHREN